MTTLLIASALLAPTSGTYDIINVTGGYDTGYPHNNRDDIMQIQTGVIGKEMFLYIGYDNVNGVQISHPGTFGTSAAVGAEVTYHWTIRYTPASTGDRGPTTGTTVWFDGLSNATGRVEVEQEGTQGGWVGGIIYHAGFHNPILWEISQFGHGFTYDGHLNEEVSDWSTRSAWVGQLDGTYTCTVSFTTDLYTSISCDDPNYTGEKVKFGPIGNEGIKMNWIRFAPVSVGGQPIQ